VYQLAVRESYDGKPLGCSMKLRWWNRGMVWAKLRWLEPIKHKRGFWVGVLLTPMVKPQWVCYKLDETILKSCSHLLAIHQRQCIFGKMEIF
jgi:hypothetical protein